MVGDKHWHVTSWSRTSKIGFKYLDEKMARQVFDMVYNKLVVEGKGIVIESRDDSMYVKVKSGSTVNELEMKACMIVDCTEIM